MIQQHLHPLMATGSRHLVQQQYRVLRNNLAETPVLLTGSANVDLTSSTSWKTVKEEYKVIVCTAQVLQDALGLGLVEMSAISLLVLDECHHTKKEHPYSRILRSYYTRTPSDLRPKIFGMTASPVDTKKDVTLEARDLEDLMHAKIATTDDMTLLTFAPIPADVKWTYTSPQREHTSHLREHLISSLHFCDDVDLRKGIVFCQSAAVYLGPWCADRVWHHILGDTLQGRSALRKRYEQSEAYARLESLQDRQRNLHALEEAELMVYRHGFTKPQLLTTSMSSKMIVLHDRLKERYQLYPDTRAIVFVNERLKARVLNDCFKALGVPKLRSDVLLGLANASGDDSGTVKHQEETLDRFRAGVINLVFATSVADEGLDIPSCNLVVRFDLCATTIQYMQSRGRARMVGSVFVHMLEEGDLKAHQTVEYMIANERWIKAWCGSLPPDRKLGTGSKLQKMLARDNSSKSFKTTSGAVCDNSNALVVLARFAASLRHASLVGREVYTEEIEEERGLFRYTVRLPSNEKSPVKGCRGEWRGNKQLAKRSAAWSCCYLLRQKGLLTENLNSAFHKIKPENLNARLAVSKQKSAYVMQVKPAIWAETIGTLPAQLHATVLRFKPERPLKHKLASLVVLTRTPLPKLPSFPAYLEDKIRTEVTSVAIMRPLPVSAEELDLLTAFTLDGVFSDVFNKVYAHEMKMMSYWLAPTARNLDPESDMLCAVVDVDALMAVKDERLAWSAGMCGELWTHRFLCDPLNGKFHYFTGRIVPDRRPGDPIPPGIPKIAQKKTNSILDFSDSTWTGSKKRVKEASKFDPDQPVLEADLTSTKRNFLDPTVSSQMIACQIVPCTLQVARISSDFAASCLVWPAIIHRIESYMIAKEAFDKLGLPHVQCEVALEALTKDADNEDDGPQTHTGGTRGMGSNYERLEFIGDSLLKMTTTMTVFNRTTCDEGGMHCRRMAMLCNRNLFNVATGELGLTRHARSLAFNRNTWYPEHLTLLHGRGAKKEPVPNLYPDMTQDLGMKTIADMSEAIIGAAVSSSIHLAAPERFNLGIQAITQLVQSEDHDVHSWHDIVAMYEAPAWSLEQNDAVAMDLNAKVSNRTGYVFHKPRLLRSAFTHPSDTGARIADYQRLEFLGDAVLDWACVSWLFYSNPTRNPQWLTEHKMAMVSNSFLAALAVTLDFDKFLPVNHLSLMANIQSYAGRVREARGEASCPPDFWTEIKNPPKALSDLVESYLGAVLIDSEWDYNQIESFFHRFVLPFFQQIEVYDSYADKQPTTWLHNTFTRDFKCRDFTVQCKQLDAGEGDTEYLGYVMVHDRLVAEGRGTSSVYTKIQASKRMLQQINGMDREEFRRRYGCDCKNKTDAV